MQTYLILAGSMTRSLLVARAGGEDDGIDEWEVMVEKSRAPSRARRSSLENDRFVGQSSWAMRAVGLTRLPSFARPRPLTMPFGDDGMVSTTVVSNQSLALAVARLESGAEDGGWSKGS